VQSLGHHARRACDDRRHKLQNRDQGVRNECCNDCPHRESLLPLGNGAPYGLWGKNYDKAKLKMKNEKLKKKRAPMVFNFAF
jgi:hypothetical protein